MRAARPIIERGASVYACYLRGPDLSNYTECMFGALGRYHPSLRASSLLLKSGEPAYDAGRSVTPPRSATMRFLFAFAFGGNKVRKMRLVAAAHKAAGDGHASLRPAVAIQPRACHRSGRREARHEMHPDRQRRRPERANGQSLLDGCSARRSAT